MFFEHTCKKSINLQKQISSCQKIHPQKLSQIIKNHQKIGNPVSVKRNLAQSIQNHRQGQANLVKIQHFIIIHPKFYRISSGFDDFKSENTEFIHSILAFLTNIKSVWAQLQSKPSCLTKLTANTQGRSSRPEEILKSLHLKF